MNSLFKWLAVAVALGGAPSFAEAGLPQMFCGEQMCACGTVTCGCGQVCNLAQQKCMSAQAGFCSSDSNCTASCGQFICEGNVCVKGLRQVDSGTPAGPDGGDVVIPDAGVDAGTPVVDGGAPKMPSPPPPTGCSTVPGFGVLALLSVLAFKRRAH